MSDVGQIQKAKKRPTSVRVFGCKPDEMSPAERAKAITGYQLRHRIEALVSGVTHKKIKHHYYGDGACTNDDMMVLPSIPQTWLFRESDAKILLGYTAHEISHHLETPFDILNQIFADLKKVTKPEIQLKNWWNAIEEYRIEKITRRVYPGFSVFINETRRHSAGQFNDACDEGLVPAERLANPYAIGAVALTWVGERLNGYPNPNSQIALGKLDENLRDWVESWEGDLAKVEEPEDSLDLARRILADLQQHAEEEPQDSDENQKGNESQDQSSSSQDGDESKSGDSQGQSGNQESSSDKDQSNSEKSGKGSKSDKNDDSSEDANQDGSSSGDKADGDETDQAEDGNGSPDQSGAEKDPDEDNQTGSGDSTDSQDQDGNSGDADGSNPDENDQPEGQEGSDSSGESDSSDGDVEDDNSDPDGESNGDDQDDSDPSGEEDTQGAKDGSEGKGEENNESPASDASPDQPDNTDNRDDPKEDQGQQTPAQSTDNKDSEQDGNEDGDDSDGSPQNSSNSAGNQRPKPQVNDGDDEVETDLADLNIDELLKELAKHVTQQDRTQETIDPNPAATTPTEVEQNQQEYARLRAELGPASARSAGVMRRLLQSQANVRTVRGLEEGALDLTRLVPIVNGSREIYSQQHRTQAINTAVSVMLDNSGSMCGEPLEVCQKAAIVLDSTISGTGTDLEINGFTGSSYRPVIYRYRSFGQKGRSAAGTLGGMQNVGVGGTPVSTPMLEAWRRLKEHKAPRKILIVITDGEAEDPGRTKEVHDLINYQGGTVVGIAIGRASMLLKWCDLVTAINNIEDLPKALTAVVQNLTVARKAA